jgi:hypothetical protein
MPTQSFRHSKLRPLTRSRGAPSETSISSAMRAGDPAAIDALYAEYGGTVFAYLVRALGDRSAAEDVRQQVFAEVWQRIDSYDSERAGLDLPEAGGALIRRHFERGLAGHPRPARAAARRTLGEPQPKRRRRRWPGRRGGLSQSRCPGRRAACR